MNLAGGLDGLTIGRKLASGRDADVFDLGDGRILRRNRNGRSTEREAEILRHVRAYRYPAPEVYAASGPDIAMERVDGPTMLRDLVSRPWMVWRHARLLARLHRQLATVPPLEWMRPFPPDELALAAGSRLVGEGGSLLHLDLHPDNVILSPRGPVVIDWESAKRGEVAAAVALTWVVVATSQPPGSWPVRLATEIIRRLLMAELLRHVDRAAVLHHLPAVARHRLADRNLLASERPAIHRLLRAHRPDAALVP